MLRNYEFTVIFRSDLGDESLTATLSDYEGIITNDGGGTILKKDEWGTKRFAYPIKKHFRGYYVCYVINTTPKVIKDIEQHIRYDNKVLRYILIAIKGGVPVSSSDVVENSKPDSSEEGSASVSVNTSDQSPDTDTSEQREQST